VAQEAKTPSWQEILEKQPFSFRESEASVLFSLSQFGAACQVHMVFDPAKHGQLTFKFVKADKEVLSLTGHNASVFRVDNNILYFAHFGRSSTGCSVAAYDLNTGKSIWAKSVTGLGGVRHSAYRNAVTMSLSTLTGDKERRAVVVISGRESFGDYVEILDQKTGDAVASKVYRRREFK
jgi:hypothetical protein